MENNPITEFACCYLHEDWLEDYADLEEALNEYIYENSREDQIALGNALVQLLKDTQTEAQLDKRLSQLDWQIYTEDVPMRTVLQEMSEILLAEQD